MRTGTLLVLFVASGCFGAEVGGRRTPDETIDASTSRDAVSIDGPMTTTNGTDAGGGMTPTAACMAKGYSAVAGLTSLYRTSAASASWTDAHAACNADVVGATHLVVLSSDAESQYVVTQLGWVGLSDRTTENVFVNVTNESPDKRPFSSGQPDNGSGTEDCVQMKSDGLDDDQCENAHRFVCECDGRAPAP